MISISNESVPKIYELWERITPVWIFLTICFYYLSISSTIEISQEYAKFMVYEKHYPSDFSGLHLSWISGRRIDLKDPQFHGFRNMLPYLVIGASTFLLLSHTCNHFLKVASRNKVERALLKCLFYSILSLVVLYYLHGVSFVIPVLLTFLNYMFVGHLRYSNSQVLLSWLVTLTLLISVNFNIFDKIDTYWGNYKFFHKASSSHQVYPWKTCFNFCLLRIQSFNIDTLRESSKTRSFLVDSNTAMKNSRMWAEKPIPLDKLRKSVGGFIVYFSYVFYPPLYVAGPIIQFNSFIKQIAISQIECEAMYRLRYLLRFAVEYAMMEVMCHYLYVGAITYNLFVQLHPAGSRSEESHEFLIEKLLQRIRTPGYITITFLSYWMLMFLWMKFLLIWRFFRAWSVLDNIHPPENMQRCMNNNYTVSAFWKGWHSSFNQWLIEYMYVPLGGKKVGLMRYLINVSLCFTFVAIWHDIHARLLVWSSAFSLLLLPEYLLRKIAEYSPISRFLLKNPSTKVLATALLGGGNILLLKAANLIGFVFGVRGFRLLTNLFSDRYAVLFLTKYYFAMVLAVILMQYLQYRRSQKTTREHFKPLKHLNYNNK